MGFGAGFGPGFGVGFARSEAAPSAPELIGTIPTLSATFGTGTHQFDLSAYFSGADTYAIDPAVEAGWSFDVNTGVLEIDTDDENVFGPFIVTASNANGDTASNAFTVRVSTFIQASAIGGTAVDATGIVGTTFLDDATPVPAGAFFINGIAHDANGLRYVCLWPGDDVVFRSGGIAVRPDGAMCVATGGTPEAYARGFALTERGEVIVSTSAPELQAGGFGVRYDGSLCVSEAA
jgi:hypothetical protein